MAMKLLVTIIVLVLVFSFFLSMLSVTVDFASKTTERALDGTMEEEQKDTIIEMIERMDFARILQN
jgi:flagellar biosynthesis/type III secretory pathway M-ring protein FliF/YscJ